MKWMNLIRLLAVAILSVVSSVAVEAGSLPDDVMPLSEVKAGMKGEAFSVVHGFKLERYEVEILGIEQGGLAGSAMILALVKGPSIEQHGIVAGMSGSPVYIDGKVIGALSYGFQFAYRPIAGITPIESMLPVLDLLDEDQQAGGGGSSASASSHRPADAFGWDWKQEWEAYSGFEPVPGLGEGTDFKASSPEVVSRIGDQPLRMIPLSTPFYVSALSPLSAGSLGSFFAARGLSLMPTGSSGGSNPTPDEPSPPMVGGSALAIPIMWGDLSISAVGTATYRSGDKILAFGHPAFSRGSMRAPMAQAYMIAYMQSYALSFKLGESREIVGSVMQDKQFGIGGVFGDAPPNIDIKVNVKGEAAKPARPYHYTIWKDRDFSPMFSMVALTESLTAAVAAAGELTGDCTYRIRLADGREIVKTDRGSSRNALGAGFARPLLQDMFLLLNNPFEEADVQSIDIELDVRDGFHEDELISAEPAYTRIAQGDDVVLRTRWRPYRGAEYEKTVTLKLSEELNPGQYVVHLGDAGAAQRIDTLHNRGKFRPRDFEQVVALAQRLDYPDNRLTAYVFEPEIGMSLQGETVEGIPASIERMLVKSAPQHIADPVIGRLVQSESIDFENPVSGRATFLIELAPFVPR